MSDLTEGIFLQLRRWILIDLTEGISLELSRWILDKVTGIEGNIVQPRELFISLINS